VNWLHIRKIPWLDTRARFVAGAPASGTLLDLGSSDGETLGHFRELRPDLKLHAVDLAGQPEKYPPQCEFRRANLERDSLPWPACSMDRITCMHLVEHLATTAKLMEEVARLLRPGGKAYFETPHPKTVALPSPRGRAAGTFTLNFYDDPTHIRPVAVGALGQTGASFGLRTEESGTSRNWLFAVAWPVFACMPASRQKFTSRVHWLGWSAYIVLAKPIGA
jgi:SAM-dependent methyltransferase